MGQVKPAQTERTALPVQIRSNGPTAPAWPCQASATSVAVATTVAQNSVIQARRSAQRRSHSHRAASIAGRVGNISRHSNSQPREKRTETAITRGAVGRASQTAPSAIAANITV